MLSKKNIEIDNHSSCVVYGALVQSLKTALQELAVLREIRETGVATPLQRHLLPKTLRKASLDQLIENVDPWVSLVSEIEYWCNIFDPSAFDKDTPEKPTVEEFLNEYAVLDGQGNLDGLFVPLSIAHLSVELFYKDKLKLMPYSHREEQDA